MDWYSASTDERETIGCFLDFQEMREVLRNTQKPEIEQRVSGQETQSEFAKALSCTLEFDEKKSLWPRVRLMYCKM